MLPLSPPSPAPPSLPKSPKQRHRGGRTLESSMFSKLIFMKYHLCWNSPGQKAGVFALPRFNNDNTSSRRGCWLRRSTCWFHIFATKYTYLLNQVGWSLITMNWSLEVQSVLNCYTFFFTFTFLQMQSNIVEDYKYTKYTIELNNTEIYNCTSGQRGPFDIFHRPWGTDLSAKSSCLLLPRWWNESQNEICCRDDEMGLKKKLHLAKSATTTFWRAFICFFLCGDGEFVLLYCSCNL